jgi:hypothetical protein
MNQTKKRLSIINLAISITDIETIQLQILKLGLLNGDQKLKEIIEILNAKNYAQAQRLITVYLETPHNEVLQRSAQVHSENTLKEQEIIDEFDLFTLDEPEETQPLESLDLDDFLKVEEESVKSTTTYKNTNFDALLNLEKEDILSDNIQIEKMQSKPDIFFQEEDTLEFPTPSVPRDTFFDVEDCTITEEIPQNKEPEKDSKELETMEYPPIAYIEKKFKNMQVQYPFVEVSETKFSSVSQWLNKIEAEGYNETEVEETIQYIDKISSKNKAEAGQLLLITAATQSKYAQFRLARALYKGELVEKNLAEAFTMIHRLATHDDYPEAICDLAQFYEFGIGIKKDTKQAELFYKDAMDLGIQRASSHYERLHKNNKGLFAFFMK